MWYAVGMPVAPGNVFPVAQFDVNVSQFVKNFCLERPYKYLNQKCCLRIHDIAFTGN